MRSCPLRVGVRDAGGYAKTGFELGSGMTVSPCQRQAPVDHLRRLVRPHGLRRDDPIAEDAGNECVCVGRPDVPGCFLEAGVGSRRCEACRGQGDTRSEHIALVLQCVVVPGLCGVQPRQRCFVGLLAGRREHAVNVLLAAVGDGLGEGDSTLHAPFGVGQVGEGSQRVRQGVLVDRPGRLDRVMRIAREGFQDGEQPGEAPVGCAPQTSVPQGFVCSPERHERAEHGIRDGMGRGVHEFADRTEPHQLTDAFLGIG